MNLLPMADRIVVETDQAEEMSASGKLHIPQVAQERHKPQEGTVVAVGPGRVLESGQRWPIDASIVVGRKVLYTKYSGSFVTVDGRDYLIVQERDILSVVKEGAVLNSVSTESPRKDVVAESFKTLMARQSE